MSRKSSKVENEEEILEEQIECGHLHRADELIEGICPDCRELMEAEMDLGIEEMKQRFYTEILASKMFNHTDTALQAKGNIHISINTGLITIMREWSRD